MTDWNGNGKYDASDRYTDYKMSGGNNNNSGGGLGVLGIALICIVLAMELAKIWPGFIVIIFIIFIAAGVIGVF